MIKTMKGAKSNFQIKAMNMKPNCQNEKSTIIKYIYYLKDKYIEKSR